MALADRRANPVRAARPDAGHLVLDDEGLTDADQACECEVLRDGGRNCVDPRACGHLSRGVGCAHYSPFVRQLHNLVCDKSGALRGIRASHSEVGDGGSGVESFRDFAKGTPLLLYEGRYAYARPSARNVYVMELPASVDGSRRWLVGDPETSLACRANHSCSPNMDVVKLRFPGGPAEPIVVFYASKRVQGTRHKPVVLTLSYEFVDAEVRAEKCRCGSRQCCGLFGCNPTLCAERRAV